MRSKCAKSDLIVADVVNQPLKWLLSAIEKCHGFNFNASSTETPAAAAAARSLTVFSDTARFLGV